MNEDLFIQPTERALRAKAYQCPNFFWSPKSRLDNMAEYYHIYHLRLQWNAKERSVVVDLDNNSQRLS